MFIDRQPITYSNISKNKACIEEKKSLANFLNNNNKQHMLNKIIFVSTSNQN